MSISLTKRKFLFQLTLLTLLLGVGGGTLYFTLVPEHYFGGYPFIPVYFYAFGIFNIYVFDACRHYAPDKMLLFYLALKMLKMILSIVVLVMYCIIVHDEVRAFLLTFIANYLIYLIFETGFFAGYEMRKRHQKKNKTRNETVA